jgi:hemerythrin
MEINSNYQQNANTSVEILMFLNNWISHHIRETDSKFGNFVEVQNLTKRFNREHPKQKTT